VTTTIPLTGCQDWYLRACDEEWDAAPGVHIDPAEAGWAVTVDLADAGLVGRTYPELTITRTADDWLHAWTDGRQFHADCGPLSLTEAIKTYLAWAGPSSAQRSL
jgi:hypothetical protein